MDKKRKAPARASRAESSKKRILTPPELRQTPTPADSPAPPVVYQELLPKKIEAGKALPTVEEPQNLDALQAKDYQSVADSGVLADSLIRSRQKWLSEGIFEKYWTKPVKKKGAPDVPANNPAKESMTKLGNVTICVEPHVFEAQMYMIKNDTPRSQLPQSQPINPMYRPIIQYGPPSGSYPIQNPMPTPPIMQRPPATPQANSQFAKTEDVHMSNSTPPPNPSQFSNAPHTNGATPSSNTPRQTPQPQALPPARGTDPVIQMLAERAATDPELKALMRIVANGEATHTQLKSFQNHIDDLTRLQKARQAALLPQTPALLQNITNVPAPTYSPASQKPSPAPSLQPIKQESQPQPQALRSKGPLPPPKSDIAGIALEFTGGNGDRYLFPKFSILEPLPNNQMLASFLIVRKGSSSEIGSGYDKDLDYYQPITVRICNVGQRQMEGLKGAVRGREEVMRYMEDVMDGATRAEYVLLAMRLPREREGAEKAKEGESGKEDQMDQAQQVVGWATTGSEKTSVPEKVKVVKPVPTEEEQYQTFINAVKEVV